MPITVKEPDVGASTPTLWKVETADSWIDAVVTILAVVVFGLGWGLVETFGWALADGRGWTRVEPEHAESLENRYDRMIPEAWLKTGMASIELRSPAPIEDDPAALPGPPTAILAAISFDAPGVRTRRWTAPDQQDSKP